MYTIYFKYSNTIKIIITMQNKKKLKELIIENKKIKIIKKIET